MVSRNASGIVSAKRCEEWRIFRKIVASERTAKRSKRFQDYLASKTGTFTSSSDRERRMCTNSWYRERPFGGRTKTKGLCNGDGDQMGMFSFRCKCATLQEKGRKRASEKRDITIDARSLCRYFDDSAIQICEGGGDWKQRRAGELKYSRERAARST